MPGTMSKEMPAARSAAISSPARPKISGSPDFRRTTRLPCPRLADEERVDLVLADGVGALGLADIDAARVAAALRDDRLGHQPVVDDDVGFLQARWARSVSRSSAPGPAPTSETWPAWSGSISSDAERLAPRPRRCGRRRPSRRSAPEKKRAQKRRRSATERERPRDALAQALGEAGEVAEGRRQQRLDAGADVARQHRRDALAADRDGERRAVDDRRRVEIAKLGTVDDVDRHAGLVGERPDLAVALLRAGGGEDQRGAGEVGERSARRRASRHGRRSGRRRSPCRATAAKTTISALVSDRSRILAAASAPPPTTTTRRPATLWKAGKTASLRAASDMVVRHRRISCDETAPGQGGSPRRSPIFMR